MIGRGVPGSVVQLTQTVFWSWMHYKNLNSDPRHSSDEKQCQYKRVIKYFDFHFNSSSVDELYCSA